MEKRNLLLLFQISVHQQCYEKLAMWGSAVEKEEILSTHRSEGDTEIGQRILVSLHERIACSLPSRKLCRAHWPAWSWGYGRVCYDLISVNGEGACGSSWLSICFQRMENLSAQVRHKQCSSREEQTEGKAAEGRILQQPDFLLN